MQPTQKPPTGDPSGAPDAVRDVLLAAAKYLTAYGWDQCELYADSHSVNPAACTVGALSMVCYGYPAEVPAFNVTHPGFEDFDAALFRLDCYVTETFGPEAGGVLGFNDTPGRTVADVLAMLRNAAAWTPGPVWSSVPRCDCGDRMLLDGEQPFIVTGDGMSDDGLVARVFTCRTCDEDEYVEVTDPDDRTAVAMAYRVWVLRQPHEGAPHIPGTSDDCDTCEQHCFCTSDLLCVVHGDAVDDTLSTWDVPGLPTYAQLAGGAA
ncbi:hypothetical protein [Dactylosporangium sp. NPDC050588]|uniref:DUF6197 family protein n=1 Tax=Dactylosporangium sp. NPDC050588 TaxID=3157211 RepID=UPI0033C64571